MGGGQATRAVVHERLASPVSDRLASPEACRRRSPPPDASAAPRGGQRCRPGGGKGYGEIVATVRHAELRPVVAALALNARHEAGPPPASSTTAVSQRACSCLCSSRPRPGRPPTTRTCPPGSSCLSEERLTYAEGWDAMCHRDGCGAGTPATRFANQMMRTGTCGPPILAPRTSVTHTFPKSPAALTVKSLVGTAKVPPPVPLVTRKEPMN